jgi:RNA-directed DNA polymerase
VLLLKMWLEVPVEEEDKRGRKKRATPGRAFRKGLPFHRYFSICICGDLFLGWKRAGMEQRLGARIVKY